MWMPLSAYPDSTGPCVQSWKRARQPTAPRYVSSTRDRRILSPGPKKRPDFQHDATFVARSVAAGSVFIREIWSLHKWTANPLARSLGGPKMKLSVAGRSLGGQSSKRTTNSSTQRCTFEFWYPVVSCWLHHLPGQTQLLRGPGATVIRTFASVCWPCQTL